MVTVADRVACLQALSRLRRREGNPEAALRILETALALSRQAQDPWSRADILRERMRVSWDALPREQAIGVSQMALDWIETIREQQSGDASRAGLLSLWAEDYYWPSGRLLEEGTRRCRRSLRHHRAPALADAPGVSRGGPCESGGPGPRPP